MKKYLAPEVEIYNYVLEEDILGASTYGGTEVTEDSGNDPIG